MVRTGMTLTQGAWGLLFAILLAPVCAVAATPDRTTIPSSERSALAAFARPQTSLDQIPVLPAYEFEDGGQATELAGVERYPVREIRIVGADALEATALTETLAAFEGRTLSFNEMVELRDTLTALYVDSGYVTSGAVLEALDDGVLRIQIIEGTLERIDVRSTGHFRGALLIQAGSIGAWHIGKPGKVAIAGSYTPGLPGRRYR